MVATLSRMGRRVSFVSSLMDAGTPFACADAPDDEPFILHVKASFAEEEARKISQRTKACPRRSEGARCNTRQPKEPHPRGTPKGQRRKARARENEHRVLLPQIAEARLEGLTIRAIAQRVGVSPMTVSRLLQRGLVA